MSQVTDDFVTNACEFGVWYVKYCIILPIFLAPFMVLFVTCASPSTDYTIPNDSTEDWERNWNAKLVMYNRVMKSEKPKESKKLRTYVRRKHGILEGFNGIVWGTQLDNVEGVKQLTRYSKAQQAEGISIEYVDTTILIAGTRDTCRFGNTRARITYTAFKGQFYAVSIKVCGYADTLTRTLLATYPFHWQTYGDVQMASRKTVDGSYPHFLLYLPIANKRKAAKKHANRIVASSMTRGPLMLPTTKPVTRKTKPLPFLVQPLQSGYRGKVRVKSYTKRDGAEVSSHTRKYPQKK